jgi:hypothetical protein
MNFERLVGNELQPDLHLRIRVAVEVFAENGIPRGDNGPLVPRLIGSIDDDSHDEIVALMFASKPDRRLDECHCNLARLRTEFHRDSPAWIISQRGDLIWFIGSVPGGYLALA